VSRGGVCHAPASGGAAGKAHVVAPPDHANERIADHAAAEVLSLQRGRWMSGGGASAGGVGGTLAPRAVGEELTRAGEPIDPDTRRLFEPRFGRDFSSVRIHRDGPAQRSATAIGARAFTSGDHIVFGPGGWQPESAAGLKLMAHELAHHALQQRGDASTVWRKPLVDLDDFDSGSFSDATLIAYLKKLRTTGKIEDNRDSDDKARGVVRAWLKGGDAFTLEPDLKYLLIKEMQSGFTGDDDERAILNLLEKSSWVDVRILFRPGLIDPEDLDSDFQGDEETELRSFYDRIFVGGRKAALKGKGAILQDEPVLTLGKTYSHVEIRAVIDSWKARVGLIIRDREKTDKRLRPAIIDKTAREEADVLGAQLKPFSTDEKVAAVKDLSADRSKAEAQSRTIGDEIAAAATQEQRDIVARKGSLLNGEILLLELTLEAMARDVALAAPAAAADQAKLGKTLDADAKKAAKDAIAPRTMAAIKAEAKGAAPPPPPKFKPGPLPGEKLDYEAKITARIPGLIKAKHDRFGKPRTAADHADPAKSRSMADMQKIANQAKDEVDLVFAKFYDKSKFTAFQGDVRDPTGKLVTRGNLRDAWQIEEDRRKDDPKYEEASAKFWLFYLIQNDEAITAINLAHDASPDFGEDSKAQNDEAKAIRRAGDPFVKSEKTRLFEIGRGWDAFKQGKDVLIQLFKNPDMAKDRSFLWEMYLVLMHEYLHKLAEKDHYNKYAEKIGGEHSTPGNSLIEGVDSLLTEIAW